MQMRKEAEEQQIPTDSRNTASNCQQMFKEEYENRSQQPADVQRNNRNADPNRQQIQGFQLLANVNKSKRKP